MMGRLKTDQGQFFYEYRLDALVPADHLVRKLDAVVDLSWLRAEAAQLRITKSRRSCLVSSGKRTPRLSMSEAPDRRSGPITRRSCLGLPTAEINDERDPPLVRRLGPLLELPRPARFQHED